MMLDPMLGTFRTMMAEIDEKGIGGEFADDMRAALLRMEELGQEKSDFNEFNAVMMNENLMGRFSDAYGKALSAAASGGGGSGDPNDYDDAALLKQSLDALRDAIRRIKEGHHAAIDESNSYDAAEAASAAMDFAMRNKEQYGLSSTTDESLLAAKEEVVAGYKADQAANPGKYSNAKEIEAMSENDTLIAGIQNVIDLGEEPGMSFPRFLRLQIECGLDKAMEGNILTRKGYVFNKGFIEANGNQPYHLAEVDEIIALYDRMAASAPFNQPDMLDFQFEREAIERKYEPQKIKYDMITNKWEQIIDYLDTWIRSHTKYAPYMDPWKMITDAAARQRAILRDKECTQGEIKVIERIFKDYFGIGFNDIWTHESFINAVNANYIGWSQEYVTFLRDKVYPECIPFQAPSAEQIAECERFWDEKKMYNPDTHKPGERSRDHYNSNFGEGRFEEKFGPAAAPNGSQASPWDLGAF